MEIGIDSFAANKAGGGTSTAANNAQIMQELLERIEHADKSGLDVFGIGEHHRKEFLDSANAIILSAARTKRIRLLVKFNGSKLN